MKNPALFALLAITLVAPQQAHAEALDAPYRNLPGTRVDIISLADSNQRPKNDVAAMIKNQTSVKSQEARGSCSIFSAAALLESLLIINGKADASIDLSEEWLQYLIAQWATDDGSNSSSNFRQIHERGMPSEAKLPYIGVTWKSLIDGEAQRRCGHISDHKKANCLTGHRDPALLLKSDAELASAASGALHDVQFLEARKDAAAFKQRFLTEQGANESIWAHTSTEIKELLAGGTPLTFDFSFYYGAWNHRLAGELGITRNMDHWAKGIVGYPENGSVDRARSNEKPAGHSVVVVGYDDEREIEYTVQMTDGTSKTFKRKGVYYFKNSWGADNFGVAFEIDGVKYPGYGMIAQDYAHEFGSFFRLSL